jgi:hypothetical protein
MRVSADLDKQQALVILHPTSSPAECDWVRVLSYSYSWLQNGFLYARGVHSLKVEACTKDCATKLSVLICIFIVIITEIGFVV